jgi:heme-degrading monooxygenase HmoA
MFVAINYISCKEHYTQKFEDLFATRAKAIDTMPGFHHMQVLKPATSEDPYLIVIHWDKKEDFETWTRSEAFIKGHKRGFADIVEAREKGLEPPMTSQFKTYKVISE